MGNPWLFRQSFPRPYIFSGCWILLFWLGAAPVARAAQVTLASPTAPPGSSLLLPVTFASQGDSVSGIQFDLQYDNTQMSVSATISDAARSAGKSLYIASLAPNKIRFLFVGLNQVLIPDGTLCTLFLSLNTNAPGGTYALVLSELSRTNPQSQSESVQGLDGNVFIQGSSSQAMRIQPNGVLGAASLLPGPVSPGELVTLLGAGIGPAEPVSSPGSPSLGETAVLFDGSPAPLLYAGPNQINAVVPFSVAGKISTLIQVTYRNQAVSTFSFPVAATVPAVFTQDSSGVGPGAILNQDSSLNTPSSPADKGSIISVFATGAGQTNPLSVDAQLTGGAPPKPILPVTVQIAGLDAQVLYAGAAPGLIAGMLQINCMIPQGVPSGFTVPIVITIGSSTSQPGVTIAVN